jgi:hypothetical protein
MSLPRIYKRTIPFLKVLHQAKPGVNKIELLKKFPKYVVNDFVEILYNILIGSVPIKPKSRSLLNKHRKALRQFAELPSLNKRTQFIYKQRGGFLGFILPTIISAISSILNDG